jgi:hypothetical protein
LQLANETRQAIQSIRDRFEIISIPLGGGEIFGAFSGIVFRDGNHRLGIKRSLELKQKSNPMLI